MSDPAVRDNVKIKFLALYFPQWYEDPLNRNVNGWTYFRNPNFTHNANSLLIDRPLNHIYYDPRCMEHRRTQGALAKNTCWMVSFTIFISFPMNEWVLSAVQPLMLLDGEPSTDFAFCWVNAEFSDRKTRYDKPEVLADVLLPFLRHPRCITIHGRPVLYVYFASWVPSHYIQRLHKTTHGKGNAQTLYCFCHSEPSIADYCESELCGCLCRVSSQYWSINLAIVQL